MALSRARQPIRPACAAGRCSSWFEPLALPTQNQLALSGWPVTLIDTAGIRDADDVVESEGVTRTLEAARRADAVVVVLDATRPDTAVRERLDLPPGTHVVTVLNKIDLVDASLAPPECEDAVKTSALSGHGLAELGKAILRETGLEGPGTVAPALLDPDSAGALQSLRQHLRDRKGTAP